MKGQGTRNYGIANLTDENPMTAWVEGKPGYGIGEYIIVRALTVNSIFNGYQSTPANWKNNSRVKKFKVSVNNKPLCYLLLTDEMGEQQFELPYTATQKEADFKFEIVDIYKGLKWDDVAISHIDNNGCCFASETTVGLYDRTATPVKELQPERILCINLNTGISYPANASYVTEQIHTSLLEVSTSRHFIRITPNHPLFIKGYGFTPLEQIKSILHFDSFEDINNVIEVRLWNEETKELYFEKITNIHKVTG